jgi:hypothetical protein
VKSIEALRTIFTMLEPLPDVNAEGEPEALLRRRGTVYDDVYQQLDLVEEELAEPTGAGGVIASDDEDETQLDSGSVFHAGTKSVIRPTFVENYDLQKIMWEWEAVTDWQERIQDYTDQQKTFYNDMVPKIEEFKGVIASKQGWEVLNDDKKAGVLIDIKKSVRGLYILRSTGVVQCSPTELYRLLCYTPMKPKWDLKNEYTHYLKKIGVNAYVIHSKTKGSFVLSSRDFVANMI